MEYTKIDINKLTNRCGELGTELDVAIGELALTKQQRDDLLAALDVINNDTGDWLSEEMDCSADTLIQSIHAFAGKTFEAIAKAQS